MKYVDYKKRHRELHVARRAADDRGDGVRYRAVEAEEEKLDEDHSRRYRLDEKHVARVGLRGPLGGWLQIETLDEQGQVRLYATEFYAMPAKAMLQCARVKHHLERYIAGEIDELRDEMPTAPYSCPRHQRATEGGAVNCLDCVPVTPVE